MTSFSRLLERHPDGMEEWFHWSEHDRSIRITLHQDIGGLLTDVRERAADTGGWSKSRDIKAAVNVPIAAAYAMVQDYGPEIVRDNALLRRVVMTDPDYKYLRIGRLV